MFCPNCGNKLPQSARFCKYCGCKLTLPHKAVSDTTDIRAAYEKNIDTLAETVAAFKKTHDQNTSSSLFDQTKGIVTKAICDQGVDGRDVEDVIQQVYISAYQKLDSLTDNRAAFAWFKRVATTKAIDHMRKAGTSTIFSSDYTNDRSDSSDYIESLADDTLELPEDVVDNTSTQKLIRGFIQELPKDQQKFLVARYFAEMNASQIADAFGIPAGTVRSQLSRARKTLQESILAYSKRTGVKLASYSSAPIFALLANTTLSPVPLTLSASSLFAAAQNALQGLSETTRVLGEKGLSTQAGSYTNPFIDEFVKGAATQSSQATQIAGGAGATAASTSAGSASGAEAATGGATATSAGSAGSVSAAAKGTATAIKTTSTVLKGAQAVGTAAKIGIGGKIAAGVATVAIAGATAGGVYLAGTNGLLPFIAKQQEQVVQTQQQADETTESEKSSREELQKNALKLYRDKVKNLDITSSEFAENSDIIPMHGSAAPFEYALCDINGDGVDDLLVKLALGQREPKIPGDYDNFVVYAYTANTEQNGLTSLGSYRSDEGDNKMREKLYASLEGKGLYTLRWPAGNGMDAAKSIPKMVKINLVDNKFSAESSTEITVQRPSVEANLDQSLDQLTSQNPDICNLAWYWSNYSQPLEDTLSDGIRAAYLKQLQEFSPDFSFISNKDSIVVEGSLEYALQDVTGDGIPDLIIKVPTENTSVKNTDGSVAVDNKYCSYFFVYSSNSDGSTLTPYADTRLSGNGLAAFYSTTDGNGIYSTYNTHWAQFNISSYTLSNKQVTSQEVFHAELKNADPLNRIYDYPITGFAWHSVSDLQPLKPLNEWPSYVKK